MRMRIPVRHAPYGHVGPVEVCARLLSLVTATLALVVVSAASAQVSSTSLSDAASVGEQATASEASSELRTSATVDRRELLDALRLPELPWSADELVALRAEAWPRSANEEGYLALEQGGGAYLSADSARSPWTFVFTSREPGTLVSGVVIELPGGVDARYLPQQALVRASPTSTEINRSSWPSVSRTLYQLGRAELRGEASAAADGRSEAQVVLIRFAQPVPLSVLALTISAGPVARGLVLGRVALLEANEEVERAYDEVSVVELLPLSDDERPSSGVLSIDDLPALPAVGE